MNTKQVTKDCIFMLITGGIYAIYIFAKILFTTPEGQKAVEKKINSWMKANDFLIESPDK